MKLVKLLGIALFAGVLAAAPSVRAQDKPAAPAPAAEQPAKPAPKAEVPMVYVLMKTSKGDFTIELNQEKAPISVANFLSYVDKKFYDGTIFHRVMAGFMIQGGGMDATGKKKDTDKPIKNEWANGLKNVKYSIAMARLGGPMGADSATSQFFINSKDNDFLNNGSRDFGYAVFATVVKGMDVVDRISDVSTTNKSGMGDVPIKPVIILSAKRL